MEGQWKRGETGEEERGQKEEEVGHRDGESREKQSEVDVLVKRSKQARIHLGCGLAPYRQA